MFDGLPLGFFEQGDDGNRGITEHEQGEPQQAQDLPCPAAADALMLRQEGQGPDEEKGDVCAENRCGDGLDEAQPAARQICRRQGGAKTQDAHAIAPEGGGGGLEAGVAGAAASEDAPEQIPGIFHRHLQAALDPAGPLADGDSQGGGLFVIENGVVAVAHFDAPCGAPGGEFDVFRQGEEMPAPHPPEQIPRKAEARTVDGAGGAQGHPGAVHVCGVMDVPQAVPGGEPVVAEIFGVAVAAEGVAALGHHPVHLADVVGLQQIVGVEDEECVVIVQTLGLVDLVQQEIQGVAFADVFPVEPLEHPCAVGLSQRSRAVGAVVRHHEGVDGSRIILDGDGVQQMGQHRLLIPGGDEDGVAVIFLHRSVIILVKKGKNQVDDLIEIADGGQHQKHCADGVKNGVKVHV